MRIESIFVGAKVSPQVKLHEAMTRLANTRSRRLLRPTADTTVRSVEKDAISSALGADAGSEGSIDGESSSSEAEEEVKKPAVKKKVIRRVIKKKRTGGA